MAQQDQHETTERDAVAHEVGDTADILCKLYAPEAKKDAKGYPKNVCLPGVV